MDKREAIEKRHAVRAYLDKPIEVEIVEKLQAEVDACNLEGGLNIQLCINEGQAFSGLLAKYGKFENVKNYIALVGKKDDTLDEKCGYYGQRLAIKAQQLGLNSCWVAASYKKRKNAAAVLGDEKSVMVISIGYGKTQGVPHKNKPLEELYKADGGMPDWFRTGVEAAQLAPTAMNKQKFCFELVGHDRVRATAPKGMYTAADLGIAKYNFEVGAGDCGWSWTS